MKVNLKAKRKLQLDLRSLGAKRHQQTFSTWYIELLGETTTEAAIQHPAITLHLGSAVHAEFMLRWPLLDFDWQLFQAPPGGPSEKLLARPWGGFVGGQCEGDPKAVAKKLKLKVAWHPTPGHRGLCVTLD